jgi:serine/threonine protein phosphatase PrpC
MIAHHFSHIGKRKSNQDFVESHSSNGVNFFIVADGMGGYDHGDIAAQIAVENIIVYLSSVDEINQDQIQKAINKANLAIRQKQESLGCKMGATIGGCILKDTVAHCFWVGDVQIFHFRDKRVNFESKSHTLINELKSGNIINEPSKISKYKHVVTRSLNGDITKSKAGFHLIHDLQKDDILMVCTDGVHDIFSSIQIQQIINSNFSFEESIEIIEKRLIIDAIDNASLIAISTTQEE